jgi:polysaccharide chain length determinant protein (PEP-CTERM system associated)
MLGHRSLNVEDYVTILKRRWWIILIPALILPVVAIGATYLMTPEYVSNTLVLIDQQKVPGEFVKPVVAEALDSRLAYYTEQILSRSSIEPIITKYNLYADQHLPMDARVDLARKALHIEAIQSEIARSNGLPGFKIAFTANDPHTAQQVCAEITSLFTGANLKARSAAASNTTDFLQEQINDAKRTLDDQDAKVAQFQQKYFGMLPGDQGNNENIMSGLNSRLDATTQTIQTLEQNKSVVEALLAQQVPSTSTSNVPAAQAPQAQQAELDKLLAEKADLESRYTSDYPEVKDVNRQIADLRSEMAKSASAPPPLAPTAPAVNHADSANVITLRAQLRGIDVQLQAKQKEQDDLKRQIQTYDSRIQLSPEVDAQYKELTRDSETALAFYNKLKSEMDQSQMTTDLEHRQEGETFTVLDAASLPTEPTFPKTTVFAVGGVGAGVVLGLMIVALLEYRDTALRTEREVWDFTHLPTLAVIAWSGETAEATRPKRGLFKRLFGRKQPKELLADAQG